MDNQKVRFQVPVNADLATAIAKLGEGVGRSTNWVAVNLLEASLEERERFLDWMGLAFLGQAYDVARRLAGKKSRKSKSGEKIRLQLNVPVELVKKIEKLASEADQSAVHFASMLLASGVHHHEFFLDVIALGYDVARRVGGAVKVTKGKLFPST